MVRLGNSSPKMAEVYVMAMAMALAVVASAAAPSRSILLGGGSRLSVLTPRVVRLEMETSEDEPSEPPTPTQLEFVSLPLYGWTPLAHSYTSRNRSVKLYYFRRRSGPCSWPTS